MSTSPARPTLLLALVAAMLATSASSVFIRYAQESVPSLAIAALRLSFAAAVLAPFAVLRHRKELSALTRRDLAIAFTGGAFLAVHFATWISSLQYTTVASSVVLVSTGPLWVAMVSPWLLKERIGRAAVAGLLVAIVGGTIIALGDACSWRGGLTCPSLAEAMRGKAMWGNLLALAGAWGVSGYLIVGRKLRAGMSLIPYIFVVYGVAAVLLVLVALAARVPLTGYPARAYGWIALMALVPQLIGHSTYNWVLRYLPASFVATANLGEPIGSATLAFLLLSETPPAATLFGAALILSGIYLSSSSSAGASDAG